MCYIDLAELSDLRAQLRLFGETNWNPLAFCEADHLLGSADTLDEEIRHLVEEQAAVKLDGPIQLLTVLRTWGHYFSPLNMYYCFDKYGERVRVIVAEVSNTPWQERHRYILHPLQSGNELAFEHRKEFHVSPFMSMDQSYNWQCSVPGDRLKVQICTREFDKTIFSACMKLNRRPLTDAALAWSLCRYPWMTLRIVLGIYWQAFRLWWKKCPLYTHPNRLKTPALVPTLSNVTVPSIAQHPQADRPS